MDATRIGDYDGWATPESPVTDVGPEDSVSNTLVREDTPRVARSEKRRESGPSRLTSTETSVANISLKRKRSVVFDGVQIYKVGPPDRKRKIKDKATADPPPRTASSTLSPPAAHGGLTAATLEQLVTANEMLASKVEECDRKIDLLLQQNAGLERRFQDLEQSTKKDSQHVEVNANRTATELKDTFNRMLEKTETRIQTPIDRLLEELGRVRPTLALAAAPSTPAPASAPRPQVSPGHSRAIPNTVAPLRGHIPSGPSKQFHDNREQLWQPNRSWRGSSGPRGYGRGGRGGYTGYSHGHHQPHHQSQQRSFQGHGYYNAPPAPSEMYHYQLVPVTTSAPAPVTPARTLPNPRARDYARRASRSQSPRSRRSGAAGYDDDGDGDGDDDAYARSRSSARSSAWSVSFGGSERDGAQRR
ncbi:hypothetical protein BC834DRAFT_203771 [Gloeopeniophorella convolvens]|nr:hypothetical protein BC834DRAFT_203771 [Gloeopeniophorella convolvens]